MANRRIPNDHPEGRSHESLDANFVAAITEAQVSANKGWSPENSGLIDLRVVDCPECGGGGMNASYGYWAFECGAQILPDGEIDEPCQIPQVWTMHTQDGMFYPVEPSVNCKPEDHGKLNEHVVKISNLAGRVLWSRPSPS